MKVRMWGRGQRAWRPSCRRQGGLLWLDWRERFEVGMRLRNRGTQSSAPRGVPDIRAGGAFPTLGTRGFGMGEGGEEKSQRLVSSDHSTPVLADHLAMW